MKNEQMCKKSLVDFVRSNRGVNNVFMITARALGTRSEKKKQKKQINKGVAELLMKAVSSYERDLAEIASDCGMDVKKDLDQMKSLRDPIERKLIAKKYRNDTNLLIIEASRVEDALWRVIFTGWTAPATGTVLK